MGPVAYRLQLPEGVGLHPVFHVSLLKKSISPANSASMTLPAPLDDIEQEGEPVAVLDKRVVYNNSAPLTQVLVQWSHLTRTTPRGSIPLISYNISLGFQVYCNFLRARKLLRGGNCHSPRAQL